MKENKIEIKSVIFNSDNLGLGIQHNGHGHTVTK